MTVRVDESTVTLELAETAIRFALARRSEFGPLAVAVADQDGNLLACARTAEALPHRLLEAIELAAAAAARPNGKPPVEVRESRAFARHLPCPMTRAARVAGAIAVSGDDGDAQDVVDEVVMRLLEVNFRWLTT
jgi:uncharacterized protein GlcG (DUF336 family)